MSSLARSFCRTLTVIGVWGLTLGLTGCGGGGSSASEESSTSETTTLSASAALGKKIFFDATLSASGQQSCSSCHDPAFGHAAPNALAAQPGGVKMELQGGRNSPSIRYLSFNTRFAFAADGTPTGGFFWDGRANSLQAQAGGPFLNPVEMANTSKAEVVARLAATSYAAEFRNVFGANVFNDVDTAYARLTLALARYQQEDSAFHPFDSKYDAVLRGQATLTAQETRGLALFNNPRKGNCVACHPSTKAADGSFPLFTDFTYDALGVPRNTELTVNADASYYDLGLCGRNLGDLTARTDLCGAFKVPSLRNVALRQAYFHNGVFKTLKEALTFYVQRDTAPEKWYPLAADGTVDKFNDLPAAYRRNVNTSEAPYNRKLGQSPALTDSEIDDVIAFLNTLSDGYSAP